MSGMSQAVNALALHVDVVDGVNTTTQTVTGIATTDTLIGVIHWTPGAAAVPVDATSHTTITAADTITVDADYSSDRLIVIWHDASQAVSARQAIDPINLRFNLVDGADGTVSATTTLTGIATNDTLLGAIELGTKADTDTVTDVLSYLSITAANTLTITALDCSNDQILVFWADADAVSPVSYSSVALKMEVIAGHATEMAVTGMVANDVILAGFVCPVTTVAVADCTAYLTAAAGKITYGTLTALNAGTSKVIVFWLDTSA